MQIRQLFVSAATSVIIMAAVMVSGFLNFVDEIFRENLTDRDLQVIGEAALELKARTGKLPSTLEDLSALARNNDLESFSSRWPDGIPVEWDGNAYLYEVTGEDVKVRTLGMDGLPGGSGEDADCEWPFVRGYWVHKLEHFYGSEWFWRSVGIAALSGIPPVLLWRFLEWRHSTPGAGWGMGLGRALAVSVVAIIVGMVIIWLQYAMGHH